MCMSTVIVALLGARVDTGNLEFEDSLLSNRRVSVENSQRYS